MPRRKKTKYDLHTTMVACAQSRHTIRRTRVRRIDTMQVRKTITVLLVLLITIALFGLMREFML